MFSIRGNMIAALIAMASIVSMGITSQTGAASAEDLDKDSAQALNTLYKTSAVAETLSRSARAVLVFPNIVKVGLVFGGSYGEGVLMTDAAVRYVEETKGWEVGVGPTVVVVDEGMAKNLSTSTVKDDAYRSSSASRA